MKISEQVDEQIREWAIQCYPEEMCGLIVDDEFIACENIAEDKTRQFKISADTYIKYQTTGNLQAVIHSHCVKSSYYPRGSHDPRTPSAADLNTHISLGVAFGITATDGQQATNLIWIDDNDRPPLYERDFIYGVTDCYSLVRDYYHSIAIDIPNYAREPEWAENGQNLYLNNFKDAGFVEIPLEQAAVNDSVLMQIRAPVPNHAAVIIGTNKILHHLQNRITGEDTLSKWGKYITHVLRYQQ